MSNPLTSKVDASALGDAVQPVPVSSTTATASTDNARHNNHITPETSEIKQTVPLGTQRLYVVLAQGCPLPSPGDLVKLARDATTYNGTLAYDKSGVLLGNFVSKELYFVLEMTCVQLVATVLAAHGDHQRLSVLIHYVYTGPTAVWPITASQARSELKERLGAGFQTTEEEIAISEAATGTTAASTSGLSTPSGEPQATPVNKMSLLVPRQSAGLRESIETATPLTTTRRLSIPCNPYATNGSKVKVPLSSSSSFRAKQEGMRPSVAWSSRAPIGGSQVDGAPVLLGRSSFVIVGAAHYKGQDGITFGAAVTLEREPHNMIDSNAIAVHHAREKVGHIKAGVAAMLAQILDFHPQILVTGTVVSTDRYNIPIDVQYFYKPTIGKPIEHSFGALGRALGHYFLSAAGTAAYARKPTPEPLPASGSATVPVNYASINGAAVSAANTDLVTIGSASFTIVGMKYHTGSKHVTVGDSVDLVRESNNPYDKNAIRVDTKSGLPIAHIERRGCERLSTIMDQYPNTIVLTATIDGHERFSSMPLTVKFSTSPGFANVGLHVVKTRLKGIFHPHTARESLSSSQSIGSSSSGGSSAYAHSWAIEAKVNSSEGTSAPAQSRTIQAKVKSEMIDWEKKRDDLDQLFDRQSEDQLAKLPHYDMPGLLSHINFFDYQKQGIRWLIHQEKGSIPAYITLDESSGQKLWKCAITNCVLDEEPKPVRGGILGDDMGLGKTLQSLALILANPPADYTSYPLPLSHGLDGSTKPRTTLIVSPLSVMANWDSQIDQHINRGVKDLNLSVALYHGPGRHAVLSRVEKGEIDVVLTSYQTLASDLKKMLEENEEDATDPPKKKKPKTTSWIFNLRFHRLVLDEAHTIKNGKSNMFEAVVRLTADRKLCLTGTLMVNKPEDIHSLLAFLEVQPLCQADLFNDLVVAPIRERHSSGLDVLRAVLSFVCLRRKKQSVMENIQLVSKTVEIRRVEFPMDSEHKNTYDTLYETARAYFVDVLESGQGKILVLVLRIRQACNHMGLVPLHYRQRATELKESIALLGPEEGASLLGHLEGAFKSLELVECAVCMNALEEKDAVILRKCEHIFCQSCLEQIANHLCPFCREPYSPEDMIKKECAEAAAKRGKIDAVEEIALHGRSPKVQAVLDAINEMQPDEKGVVFSQWTSMLDIVAAEFSDLGITFTRIDGTMNASSRIQAMKAFETERTDSIQTPRFILCSLMACGTGINLTRGNVVFMLDPWWNSAAETQAMDRVHRIGQTRPVRVMRFLMKESIEERLALSLQDAKAALGKGSIEKLSAAERRKARLTCLLDLFQVDMSKLEIDWK